MIAFKGRKGNGAGASIMRRDVVLTPPKVYRKP